MLTAIRNYRKAARGSVSVIVATTLPVLIMAAGGTVDYTSFLDRKAKLQSALDNALLASVSSVKDSTALSRPEYERRVRANFAKWLGANLKLDSIRVGPDGKVTGAGKAGLDIRGLRVKIDDRNDTVSASVDAAYKTSFLKFAAIDEITFSTSAQVERSYAQGATEIVLALDVTGSMSGSKIAELKRAAGNFLDALMEEVNKSKGKVKFKVGIVPFSQYVNVGMSNRNASWIDVPADHTVKRRTCRWKWYSTCSSYGYRNRCWWTGGGDNGPRRRICRRVRYCKKYVRKYGYRCYTYRRVYQWKGCVGSRNYPLNVRDSSYASSKVPGVMNYAANGSWNYCPSAALTPLRQIDGTAVTFLKGRINALNANGYTYIPAGLSWAARLLSPQAPFSEGASYADVKKENVRKVIVLMTDGVNTRSASYPDHSGSSRSKADSITRELCTAIKRKHPLTGKPIADIITVTFDVRDSNVKKLLADCASLGSFDARRGGLEDVFRAIGKKLTRLHLSK